MMWTDDLPNPPSVKAKAYAGLIDQDATSAIEVRCRIFLAGYRGGEGFLTRPDVPIVGKAMFGNGAFVSAGVF